MSQVDRRSFLKQSAATAALIPGARAATGPDRALEWNHYGGDAAASRYSPCSKITAANVKGLKVAWTHKTGDANARPATVIECTPIVVDGGTYGVKARDKG